MFGASLELGAWSLELSSRDHQLRSLKIKAEPHLLQSGLPHRMAQLRLVFLRIKHQKPAAARADEFAPQRPARARQIIPLVDFRIAHAAAARTFALPMLVHQPRELPQVARLQRALTRVT